MSVIELDQYPQIDNLHQPKAETIDKVRNFLSQFRFFYIKDTIGARDSIDEELKKLQNSVDVYYGEDAFTGEGSVFHGTYSQFENSDNNTVISQYFGLVSDLLDLISLALGYEQGFLQKISQQENYGLYGYEREVAYMKSLDTVRREDILIPPHVDRSLITVVISIRGFEGYSQEFDWFSIPDREGYLMVQVGTALQALTKHAIKANVHRTRGYDSSRAVFWGNLAPVQ